MKEIIVSKEICKRINTSKDLSDFYAYCERDYSVDDYDNFDDYVDDLPSYYFEEEQDKIDDLVGGINYQAGIYDEENVKRILGVR